MADLPLTDEMAVIGPVIHRRKRFEVTLARGWLVGTPEGLAFMTSRHLVRVYVITSILIVLALASEMALELWGLKGFVLWWIALVGLGLLLSRIGLLNEEFDLERLRAQRWIPAAEVRGIQVRYKTGELGEYALITVDQSEGVERFEAASGERKFARAVQQIALWYPVEIARGRRGKEVEVLSPVGQ